MRLLSAIAQTAAGRTFDSASRALLEIHADAVAREFPENPDYLDRAYESIRRGRLYDARAYFRRHVRKAGCIPDDLVRLEFVFRSPLIAKLHSEHPTNPLVTCYHASLLAQARDSVSGRIRPAATRQRRQSLQQALRVWADVAKNPDYRSEAQQEMRDIECALRSGDVPGENRP